MVKVGTAECSNCYEWHPKPEMKMVKETSYRGGVTRTYYGSEGGYAKGFSTSPGYAQTQEKWLCAKCYASRPRVMPILKYILRAIIGSAGRR